MPVNTAKYVIPQLEETGHVARAYLGIEGTAALGGGVLIDARPAGLARGRGRACARRSC